MDQEFWHKRWAQEDIGFHLPVVNPMLSDYFSQLGLQQGQSVFIPLCGKTLDIHWLIQQGYQVVGVELSESAVAQLFKELGFKANVTSKGAFQLYQSGAASIYVGDFFALTAEMIAACQAVYDRAALVALPFEMREKYVAHLQCIAFQLPQLVVTYQYNQQAMPGPPFSISEKQLRAYYEKSYQIEGLKHQSVLGGLKGQCQAIESCWRLTPIKV